MFENLVSRDKKRVHILTSGQCNNNCLFCCDRNQYGHIKLCTRFFSLYGSFWLTLKGFIKESKKIKYIHSILFTGGEPSLNKSLISFIKSANKSGYRNIGLQTNGRLLIYKNFCNELIENGLNEINISIHGSNKKIHDALTRSPGSFEEAYSGLSNMVSLKERYKFKINTNFTITRINYKDIYNYLRMIFLFNNAIDGVVLNTLMYTGNAKRFFNQLFVSYTDIAVEIKKAIDNLGKEKIEIRYRIQLSPMPFCLMLGYENYVGIFEEPLQIRNKAAEILPRDVVNVKCKECKLCKYYHSCSGIDSVYAKKTGWSEFKPVR